MKSNSPKHLQDEDIILTSSLELVKDLDHLLTNKSLILNKKEPLPWGDKIYWLKKSPDNLPQGFNEFKFTLFESKEKEPTLNDLQAMLQDKLPARLLSLILTTADELIMNAFFDAPVEGDKVLFKHTPRSENIKSPRPVELILGISKTEVALSVKDHFGSVNPQAIVKHLKKTFIPGDYKSPTQGTGAGIGLSLCVKRNTSLLIKVTPGTSSQFAVFFPIVENFRSYLEKSQIIGLHLQNTNFHK